MKKVIQLTLAAILWVPATSAQEASQPTPPAGDAAALGPNAQQRGGPRNPQGMVNWFLRDADDNVGLTDGQKAYLRESLDRLTQEALDQFRTNPPAPPAPETFRTFRQELQQAAAAGDDAKVQELQKQFQAAGPGAVFRQMRDRAMDEVGKILTPEQQEAYQQWRAVRETNLPRPMMGDPKALKDAVMGISSLSATQKSALDAAFQRYDDQAAGPGAANPVERNRLRNRLIVEVQGLLRPGQQVLATDALRQQMVQQYRAASGTQPAGRGRRMRGNGRIGSASQAAAPSEAGPGAEAATAIDPLAIDAWTAYVRTFVAVHKLEDVPQNSAYSILDELEKRAAEYMTSHRMDLDDLGLLAAQAATAEDRAAIENQRKAVYQPITDMFQELKDRLNSLLPAADQAAATRPGVAQAAASRPAGQRRSRTGRTPTTQPAGPTS